MKKKMLFMTCFLLFFVSCGGNAQKEENEDVNDTENVEVSDEANTVADESETQDKNEIKDDREVLDDTGNSDEEVQDEDVVEGPLKINNGTGIGGFEIGMTYAQIKEKYGEPSSPLAFNRLGSAKYKDLAVEVIFSSTQQYQISEDAKLIAVGAMTGGEFQGDILPDMTRTDIEALMKDAQKEDTGNYVYYTEGFSVQYENDKAVTIGVYPPYELKYEVPTMEKCETKIN